MAVLSPLSRCGGVFVVVVLPLLSHCCGFVIVITLSWCCHHGFIITVMVLPSPSYHCSFIIAVTSLQCLCCHIVAVLLLPLQCCLHHCIVMVFVAISSSPLQCCVRSTCDVALEMSSMYNETHQLWVVACFSNSKLVPCHMHHPLMLSHVATILSPSSQHSCHHM